MIMWIRQKKTIWYLQEIHFTKSKGMEKGTDIAC